MQPVTIDGLSFDALMNEERTYSADVPTYAVETGFEVSDNIGIKPVEISMTLYVTNTPVTWLHRHGSSSDRVKNVVDRLEEIFMARKLVTVVTSTDVYENMAITSIKIAKDTENFTSREIPITLKQVNKVSAAVTEIPAEYGRGGKTQENAGTANTSGSSSGSSSGTSGKSESSEEDEKGSSLLYGIIKGGRK